VNARGGAPRCDYVSFRICATRPSSSAGTRKIGDRAAGQRGSAPCTHNAVQDQPVMRVLSISGATNLRSLSSTARTVLPLPSPVRLATRKICVSTAMVASPERGVQYDVGRFGVPLPAAPRVPRGSSAPLRRAARPARRRWPGCSSPCCEKPDGLDVRMRHRLPAQAWLPEYCGSKQRGVALLTLRSVA